MTRAQRRQAEREAKRAAVHINRFRLTGDETCDRCGRHLDDGPPDAPTLSVDIGGGDIIYACGHCAPALRQVLDGITADF